MEDNPRRRLIKQSNPNLFKRYLHLKIGDREYAAYGNIFLLKEINLLPVRIHRRWSEDEFRNYHDSCVKAIDNDAVVISPFIHPAEKRIRDYAMSTGAPLIILQDTGFEERFTPKGERFRLCSEGLLLLTNDGAFANALMHPKHEVEKTYDVWVTGYTPGGERRLAKPITLDGYTIRPPKVKLLKAEGQSAKFRVTIHEGRNRQVRRMCDAAGMHCTRLRRIQEGSLRLGDLPLGKWRYLTEAEVAGLVRTPGTSGTI